MKANFKKGTKICSSKICKLKGIEQPISNFGKDKKTLDGLNNYCKICMRQKSNKYYKENKEFHKELVKQWRKNNPDKIKKYNKKWKSKNKEYLNEQNKNYIKERRENDPLFRLELTLRSRLHIALKAKLWEKDTHFAEYIGCSLENLKLHIENQFQLGMTWDNHGKGPGMWHIDHKIPLSSAKTEEELYKLCHYTNLQPLWEDDNIRKGNKILGE